MMSVAVNMTMNTIIMIESVAVNMTMKMKTMNTIITMESVAVDMTMNTIITMENVVVDMTMTDIITIMQMMYLQAGEQRHLENILKKRLRQHLINLLIQTSMVSS